MDSYIPCFEEILYFDCDLAECCIDYSVCTDLEINGLCVGIGRIGFIWLILDVVIGRIFVWWCWPVSISAFTMEGCDYGLMFGWLG